ncbi:MAG: NUDIX domain-containing protein [Phycisphaerae bacterium]|nr:NUDIX domain-containing protein [Phycisphaerae bacterium]
MTPSDWPEYCCAVLRDEGGRFLLESRPAEATHAPGSLTCFGGRRETDEHPRACIARELREELGIDPPALQLAVRLLADDRIIAWFYAGTVPVNTALRTEAGRNAVWVDPGAVDAAPLSAWHASALAAFRAGRDIARA